MNKLKNIGFLIIAITLFIPATSSIIIANIETKLSGNTSLLDKIKITGDNAQEITDDLKAGNFSRRNIIKFELSVIDLFFPELLLIIILITFIYSW